MDIAPEKVVQIKDIAAYNQQEGLALNSEEMDYLNDLAKSLGRPLTDSEVLGFSQEDSEHSQHNTFNGGRTTDGDTKVRSSFKVVKEAAKIITYS